MWHFIDPLESYVLFEGPLEDNKHAFFAQTLHYKIVITWGSGWIVKRQLLYSL